MRQRVAGKKCFKNTAPLAGAKKPDPKKGEGSKGTEFCPAFQTHHTMKHATAFLLLHFTLFSVLGLLMRYRDTGEHRPGARASHRTIRKTQWQTPNFTASVPTEIIRSR